MTFSRRCFAVSLPALLAACLAGSGITFGQSAPPPPADEAALRAQIVDRYAQISAAFRRKDAPGMMAFAAPNFQAKVPGGRTLNRAEAQQNLQQNVDALRTVRENRYTLDKLTRHGGPANVVCNVTEHFNVVFNDSRGEFGALGKSHALAGTTTYRDTWKKTNAAPNAEGMASWQMVRSEMLSTQIRLDGRPYRPSRTRPKRG